MCFSFDGWDELHMIQSWSESGRWHTDNIVPHMALWEQARKCCFLMLKSEKEINVQTLIHILMSGALLSLKACLRPRHVTRV